MAESAPSTSEIVATGMSREDLVSAEFASYFRDPTEGAVPLVWYAIAIMLLENVVARHDEGTLSSDFNLAKLTTPTTFSSKITPRYCISHGSYSAEYYEDGRIRVNGHMSFIGTITLCNITCGNIRNVSPHSGIDCMYKALHK